ncbi:receptor-like protein 48 [Ipomoea triloba]|uniref:receptor-like protein 48 n=1 Tax=Ipomoea triloba TaxID=35885 RepID=UPI00125E396B|nr:receptor-like protein 48 [Ipomoea triloba]
MGFTKIFMVLLLSNLLIINSLGLCVVDQKTSLLQIRSNLSYYPSSYKKAVQWDERVDCCKWEGVRCNDAGFVTTLDLSNEPIDHGFNVSLLLKLKSLSVFKLDGINFSVPFPDFFSDFTNLTVLSLVDCFFIGTVPRKLFQVPTLQTIDLSYSEMLEGSLPEFPEINGSLQTLILSNTKFSGNLPESIGNLRMLSHLDLSRCNFGGSIPASIGKLTKLAHLNLAWNLFSGPIPSFKLSKNLTLVDLSNNQFAGEIPFSHWDGLHNLESVYLNNNSFSGPIPVSLFSLPSLQSLYLSMNKFSGRIIDLQKNVSSPLRGLDLGSNNLEGPIPSFLFQLQNLSSLSLSSNKFNGTVHLADFKIVENFYFLDLSYNNLVVETNISEAQLPFFSQFQRLTLASCNLQHIPDFLKNQSTLAMLDLSSNNMSGEIPNWVWGINHGLVRYLNLSHNRFTRLQEPVEYGLLDYLDLHSNLLSGKIPPLPGSAAYLDLSNNHFSSTIPLDIGNQLPNVRFFSIANNRVSGRIPPSWCHAALLEVLDLSNNSLQGTIPSCLAQNNSNLGVINLKGNRLSGEIPQVFLQSCSLETLDLSQNFFKGRLPPSLVNCTKLKVLNLGNNGISDTFPCWLNNMSNLHILALRSNKFHGSISCPSHGVNNSWPSLKVIDLGSNNFSGILPANLFLELKAIVVDQNEAKTEVDYLHFTSDIGNVYYADSISLSLKGHEGYKLDKILSIFTSIDFSNNQFQGNIPESVGELKLLHLLNISHNALTGNIPPSLENLKALEALDLSFNSLTGNIPDQLVSLTLLSFINLSHNQLVGMIPQGKQFNTFGESSFVENKGLCGFPLHVSCSGDKEPASPVLQELEEEESSDYAEIYTGIGLGFVGGLGGIFVPLLLSRKWRSYYNKKIDGILSKILDGNNVLPDILFWYLNVLIQS